MFFNFDSFEIRAITFIILGALTTYSFYNNSAAAPVNKESLVNTNSISNLDSNVQLNSLSNESYIEAGVQTEVVNTYVNTGMQTSGRMWVESIRNWINEILGTAPTPSNPSIVEEYIDVGVQTNAITTWQIVKQWFFDVCSIRSSDLTSFGQKRVEQWINKLDSVQSVDHHDSESPLTILKFETESPLQQLVKPDDSASNISEVISESGLQNVESSTRVYDMNNRQDVLDLMIDPTVVFGINGAYDPADDLITFLH